MHLDRTHAQLTRMLLNSLATYAKKTLPAVKGELKCMNGANVWESSRKYISSLLGKESKDYRIQTSNHAQSVFISDSGRTLKFFF